MNGSQEGRPIGAAGLFCRSGPPVRLGSAGVATRNETSLKRDDDIGSTNEE